MSKLDATVQTRSTEKAFEAFASGRRRRLFVLVNEHEGVGRPSLTVDALARHLVDDEHVTDTDHRSSQIHLVHRELPMLEEAGLLNWDRSAGTVSIPDQVALDPSFLERTLESAELDWDAVFEALSNGRRRTVLTVLREATEALSPETLATRVAAHKPDADERTVAITLHHQHLPVLREAGLVREQEDGLQYAGDDLERAGIDTNFQLPSGQLAASVRR
ncbi:DUF7344 domain-containing protein [Natronosalvus vescus]|uniref:DUF7344 domain-containing protein n=1 Tax=Natronosalvus vescus TaxID=2953881 RepID=UPI0020912CA9|nr:hypothetical protein [Natronosalvus vescus]